MIGHYLSSALRNISRRPLNAAIKLLALALGLACLLTAHVIGDYFRQADRQWEKASRIYIIDQQFAPPGGDWTTGGDQTSSVPVARYLRADIPELEHVAQMRGNFPMRRPGVQGRVVGLPIDPEFLEMFDLEMVAGAASLDRPRTVLISDDAAARLFGGEDPIGQTLTSDGGLDLTVTGVYRAFPAASHLGLGGQMHLHALPSIDSWVDEQLALFPDRARWWEGDNFLSFAGFTYVLLPEDGSLTGAQLNRRLQDFAARRVPPEAQLGNMRIRFSAIPITALTELRFNARTGMPDGLSLVAALYVLGLLTLAIGCINFANLSAAETAARAREIGLRKTVGASRRQVAAQMLVESGVLVAVALALVVPMTGMIATAIASRFGLSIPLPDLSRLDYWASVAAIAVGAAVAAGLYPALALANLRPVLAMRMQALRGRSGAARAALIGVQFAAAGLLLIMVVVMLTQNAHVRELALRPGEDPIVVLGMPDAPVTEEARLETLRGQLLSSPAVTGVTFRLTSPFFTQRMMDGMFAQSLEPGAPRFQGQGRRVYYDYFETMGVRVLAGRTFMRGMDDSASAVIDAATAALMNYAPHEAIGQPIYRVESLEQTLGADMEPPPEYRIVGVVEREPLDIAANGPANYIYIHSPSAGFALVRLSREDVERGVAHVRETWTRLDATLANPVFLDVYFQQYYGVYAMMTFVAVALSAIAAAIAAMGLFGMAGFAAQRRRREIGVRKTLGASTPRVLAMMLWDFSKPVIVANLIAWPLAWLAARAYLNLFITRIDLTLWPFLAVLAASLLVAWLAVAVHAVRAASVKPALVLRTE